MADFVHLHVHSEYSLLDGLAHPHDLAARARELDQRALALTDHGTMFAAVEFYDACKAQDVKPIIGVEAYLARRSMKDRDAKEDRNSYHLLLLAENDQGYHNLLRLVSSAQLEGYYYYPRVDKALLEKHSEGIICTTGCPSAEIPRLVHDGRHEDARRALAWYRDLFKDRLFVELQEHGIAEFAGMNKELVALAREFKLPLVATNDAHYLRPEDASAQDILLCIQTNTVFNDPKRMRMDGADYYLKSSEEMRALWSELPEALSNTLLVAERCNVDLDFKEYHLPVFPVPAGFTPQTYLRKICEEGFKKRYPTAPPAARQRLDYELEIIHQMGFDTYFLIVWDLCRAARERDIWYNIRGSAAGSIAAYCADITSLDPLRHGLIFERFLNPGRISMPDIDLDFPDDRRQELIEYTVQKYGRENVAQIVTFGTLGAKAAIRDVGRALDYPLGEVDQVAKLVPGGPHVKLDESLERVPELKKVYESNDYLRKLIDTARRLEGVARHASTHAAGVVIADQPIAEYVPLHRPTRGDETTGFPVTQFEMTVLERVGLLKMDYLGLATLTIMRRACELIHARHGKRFDLENIPTDDPKAFELLSRGDVTGVFQVEGAGMRKVLMQMKPTKFDHIVATISLYRPGPMEKIPTYINRLHGIEKVVYDHPRLEPILDETFGVCLTGDAIVTDTITGRRLRMDQLREHVNSIWLQGVDASLSAASGRVSHWVHNGRKPVWELYLRNGAHIKATADHQFLTEDGWQSLRELRIGDYLATPRELIAQEQTFDRRKLRVLAYLLADGDLGSLASVNFVSQDPALLNEYERCLTAFDNTTPSRLKQLRHVTRVTVAKRNRNEYHAPNELLAWLRELGLKNPSGVRPGGARSATKFVPAFVFALQRDQIAYFLASLWDCDGYVGKKLWHYKTISSRLADDVQTLLLKLGIPSTVYTAPYHSTRGERISYQVTVYDTVRLAKWIQPYLMTAKREQIAASYADATMSRAPFLSEVRVAAPISKRALMSRYGIDRQHLLPRGLARERISTSVVAPLVEKLDLPETERKMRVRWEEILSIQPAGVEDVYDVTIEGLHNFVANNIIVHNCVYQEQIMRMAMDLAGYTAPQSDSMRKAVGKKDKEKLLKERTHFVEGCQKFGGIQHEIAEKLFDDIEFFARYGFNKAHGADYAVLTCQTAYLKAHYPVEYMAALLTTETGNIEKVGQLVSEARRMGFEILRPDVNTSDAVFTIASSGQAIHFSLSAIKNVGMGPVEIILRARDKGGPFKTLDDFCRRVDLRLVNRRVLESLIKAGALDCFGRRSQLLKVLDRMMAASQSAHQASDRGQLSLFGGAVANSGLGEDTFGTLPDEPELSNRDKLADEKELTGAYFSDNPLQRLTRQSNKDVSHLATQLDETLAGQVVTLAGVVTGVRVITTKKGEPMAFVQLEDPSGSVEITVFPRIYAKTRELWHAEAVVMLKGKVELREGKIQLLCESAAEYELSETPAPDVEPTPAAENGAAAVQIAIPNDDEVLIAQESEHAELELAGLPPPPEEPPVDWDMLPSASASGTPSAPVPANAAESAPTAPSQPTPVASGAGGGASNPPPARRDDPPNREHPKHLRIYLERAGDYDEEVRRLRILLTLLRSVPGRDKFSFFVPNPQGVVQLDFPNYTTTYSLVQESLSEMVNEWGALEVQ